MKSDDNPANQSEQSGSEAQTPTSRRDFLRKATTTVVTGGIIISGVGLLTQTASAYTGTCGWYDQCTTSDYSGLCGKTDKCKTCDTGTANSCGTGNQCVGGTQNVCGYDTCADGAHTCGSGFNNNCTNVDNCNPVSGSGSNTCVDQNTCSGINNCAATDECDSYNRCNGGAGTEDTCGGTHNCLSHDDCTGIHDCTGQNNCRSPGAHTCSPGHDFCSGNDINHPKPPPSGNFPSANLASPAEASPEINVCLSMNW